MLKSLFSGPAPQASSKPVAKVKPLAKGATPSAKGGGDVSREALGLIVCPKNIEEERHLAELVTFHQVLTEEVGLSAHLYSKICPLEVSKSSKKYVLLVMSSFKDSEEITEVIKMMSRRGYHLNQGLGENLFICTNQSILTGVVKGQITVKDLSLQRRSSNRSQESGLWSSFLEIVEWALYEGASDIHVNVITNQEKSQVRFTINGKYIAPARYALPTSTLLQMLGVAYQKSKGGVDPNFIPVKEQECNIFVSVGSGQREQRVMLRWASMATDDGPQVTLRLLRLDSLLATISLEELGYLPTQQAMLYRAMHSEGGAIVFSGVVGSGKSTTIATVMNQIPKNRKVVTLEDPREYIIEGAHANTINDQLFAIKLKISKRSAFNDLLLGEIRDKDTGIVFQDVVLSGQNLYTTTHARRAIGIPDKLASPMVGVSRDILSTPGALKLLVYQALLPLNCPKCKFHAPALLCLDTSPHKELQFGKTIFGDELRAYLDRIHRLYKIPHDKIYLRNPEGCEHCKRPGLPEMDGYKGRTVVAEMVEPDEQMLLYFKEGDNLGLRRYMSTLSRTPYDDANMDAKSAMECAIYKMSQGLIDPREIEPRFSAFESVELQRKRIYESGGDMPYMMRFAMGSLN